MKRILFAAAAACSLGWAAPAAAGEVFVGVFQHDVEFIGEALGIGAAGKEGGVDVHLGYRTGKIDALRVIGRPKAYGMASINSENQSNFVAAGLGWTIDLGSRFYLQPGIGIAYTDGEDELPDFREPGITPAEALRRAQLRSERIEFGSKVLFEPELALGYRFTDRVSAELAYTHLSNGQILAQGQNDGMDELGVRLVVQLGGR
jgi:opacity protein-like surface antigen